jgi:murein DD-endopeptidase MepM/ murein hydrolase activator NlpD
VKRILEERAAEAGSDGERGEIEPWPESGDRWEGKLLWPIRGKVTSGFGLRFHRILKTWKLHSGVDIPGPYGTAIAASAAGKVLAVGEMGGCGLGVVVELAKAVLTVDCHLSEILVSPGKVLTAGQPIGKVGSSGLATGPHVHLALKRGGVFEDPEPYLVTGEAREL